MTNKEKKQMSVTQKVNELKSAYKRRFDFCATLVLGYKDLDDAVVSEYSLREFNEIMHDIEKLEELFGSEIIRATYNAAVKEYFEL